YVFDTELVRLSLIIGVVVGLWFYQNYGITVGGAIVPGYLALFITRPTQIGVTFTASRVRGRPAFGGELPVATLAEEILTEGEGQIKAMVVSAGNPVLSTPNGMQVEKALNQLEFMVAIDIYINETTRHANIILPPTTGLETDHYDVVFHNLAVRNSAKYSPALFEPEAGMMHDWQIFRELRVRMEQNDTRKKSSVKKADMFARLSPDKILDLGLRFGPYGGWGGQPISGKNGLKLRHLKEEPHGIDLGPLQPCLPQRLYTANKQIQLAPEVLVNDLQRVKTTLLSSPNGTTNGATFSLIGRRDLRSNNSWMHNSLRLVKGKNRCTLMINPEDAAAQNIQPGQQVRVTSRVGTVEIEAQLTDDLMPGVVSIPHGWGHHRSDIQLDTAQQYAGVSLNDLTDEACLDELTGNAAFSGVLVKIEPM
ncbi:MAG: molybdopterin oxidoreductase family protein, partial [Chloroflexota bacterium]